LISGKVFWFFFSKKNCFLASPMRRHPCGEVLHVTRHRTAKANAFGDSAIFGIIEARIGDL
jgi:hypothetical protein